ncbi:MAG: extracellular solute-binding protein [Planctomycetota bacterium]|nr:extracellular solute-binding protein [Planctomycetota bacterium]
MPSMLLFTRRLSRWPACVVSAVITAGVGLLALTLFSGGCERSADQPTVVLYVSADDYIARQVKAAFEEETGIRIEMVGDEEAKKTTGLVNRLRAERDNPQADVFWSSEVFMTIALADEGVLEPYESPATAGWPDQWRDEASRWYEFAARARVIVYAPDRVAEEDIPQTWTDLTNNYLKGRIVMADPRFGTTGGHLGAMKAFWDRDVMPGYYSAFLMGLRANEVRMLPSGNAGVVRAVASGEADIGCTDTDDVWAARAQGHELALVYPAHNHEDVPGNGTLLIPNTIGRVAGGPNPEAAGRLIDFLLSERVERTLAESVSHNIPLRPGLAGAYPEYAVEDPLLIDYRRAAAMREEAVAEAIRILTGPPEPKPDPDARKLTEEELAEDEDEAPDAP